MGFLKPGYSPSFGIRGNCGIQRSGWGWNCSFWQVPHLPWGVFQGVFCGTQEGKKNVPCKSSWDLPILRFYHLVSTPQIQGIWLRFANLKLLDDDPGIRGCGGSRSNVYLVSTLVKHRIHVRFLRNFWMRKIVWMFFFSRNSPAVTVVFFLYPPQGLTCFVSQVVCAKPTAGRFTLPKTNIAPENQGLEDEISSWDGLFLGANC